MAELPEFLERRKAQLPEIYTISAEIPPQLFKRLAWFCDEFDFDWDELVSLAIDFYLREILDHPNEGG